MSSGITEMKYMQNRTKFTVLHYKSKGAIPVHFVHHMDEETLTRT